MKVMFENTVWETIDNPENRDDLLQIENEAGKVRFVLPSQVRDTFLGIPVTNFRDAEGNISETSVDMLHRTGINMKDRW